MLGWFKRGLDAAQHLWLFLALMVGFVGLFGVGFINGSGLSRLLPGLEAFTVC